MKTRSESAFEEYFGARGMAPMKIAEAEEKTPDYRISVEGVEVVVEVKQFDATPDELRRLEELKEGEILVLDGTPGKGVRKKITDASPQFRNLAKDRCAAILLLYNNRPFMLGNPANSYEVRVGMYGFESIVLVKEMNSQSLQVHDRKFGGSRKLTEQHNTTISAIAVMEQRGEETSLHVYHNEHAAIPLPHGTLQRYGALEFVLSKPEGKQFQDWVAVDGS